MFRNPLVALLIGVSICLFALPASSQDENEIAAEVMIEGTRFPKTFSTGPDNTRYLETVAKFEDQLKGLQ